MSKENLPSEEALFKLLALPPSRANDNSAANANVSRLEIKYPLPTDPEEIKRLFFFQQRSNGRWNRRGQISVFGSWASFFSSRYERQTHETHLLLLMYLYPKYSRLIREEDAQQIYNFNQRSDDVFWIGCLAGAVGYFLISAIRHKFLWKSVKAVWTEPGYNSWFGKNHPMNLGIFFGCSALSGNLVGLHWYLSNWDVMVSSIKPYDMDEPERAAAYKSVYMELRRLHETTYDYQMGKRSTLLKSSVSHGAYKP